jgi:hypothetical protein
MELENYAPELIKQMDEMIKDVHKLLKSAGDPEFIEMTKHNIGLAGSNIKIKDDWYKATNSYINHNIVVEPRYYFDLYPVFKSTNWRSSADPKPPSDYEYIYIDWQEDETIGSGMLTLRSKQFKEFEHGKLSKMFLQFLKKTYKDDWWKEDYDKFLANDNDIIHIIISIHDQDTTANIRHFEYDTPQGDHANRAMRYLIERVSIADVLNINHY